MAQSEFSRRVDKQSVLPFERNHCGISLGISARGLSAVWIFEGKSNDEKTQQLKNL